MGNISFTTQLTRSNRVRLASNENPYGLSPQVLNYLAEQGYHTLLSHYPDPSYTTLKRQLAWYHGVEASHIALGNGSNELLMLLAQAVLSPGDQLLSARYAFEVFPSMAKQAKAVYQTVPLSGWCTDLNAMLAAITSRTRMIVIANPGNPTGGGITLKALQAFLEQVPNELIVVIDEAYYEYAKSLMQGYATAISLLEAYPNLVVTRTFSKAHGLAGLRMGYGLAQPKVIEKINAIRQPFHVNHIAAQVASVALKDRDHIRRSVTENRREHARLTTFFQKMGWHVLPGAGNFLTINIHQDATVYSRARLQCGVQIKPLTAYGLPTFIRVSIGTAVMNQQLITVMQSITKMKDRFSLATHNRLEDLMMQVFLHEEDGSEGLSMDDVSHSN